MGKKVETRGRKSLYENYVRIQQTISQEDDDRLEAFVKSNPFIDSKCTVIRVAVTEFLDRNKLSASK